MIKKLRKKFIMIGGLSLFAMILIVMAAINIAFYCQTSRHLDSKLSSIMKNADAPTEFGQKPDRGDFMPEEKPGGNMPFGVGGLKIQADGCLIFLDEDNTIKSIRQDAANRYSEDNIQSVVKDIISQDKTKGWNGYYKYLVETHNESKVISLINASSDIYSILWVAALSIIIGAVSFLIAFLIIILASRRATRPVAESYARQKQFVTDAGHELKTPLTAISADNEVARMLYGDSEWFDGIDAQVSKMTGLVKSLITLSRMDEEIKPEFSEFNLSDAVWDTAETFKNIVNSQGKIITFDIEDDVRYNGDESMIRQLVSILMDNAAKYCDDSGKIAVSLKGGKKILLRVINDFSDADECQFDKVFERFYRADKARTPDGSYGLGLSIAKSITELHKGTISAAPIAHKKVMFEVTLRN